MLFPNNWSGQSSARNWGGRRNFFLLSSLSSWGSNSMKNFTETRLNSGSWSINFAESSSWRRYHSVERALTIRRAHSSTKADVFRVNNDNKIRSCSWCTEKVRGVDWQRRVTWSHIQLGRGRRNMFKLHSSQYQKLVLSTFTHVRLRGAWVSTQPSLP